MGRNVEPNQLKTPYKKNYFCRLLYLSSVSNKIPQSTNVARHQGCYVVKIFPENTNFSRLEIIFESSSYVRNSSYDVISLLNCDITDTNQDVITL